MGMGGYVAVFFLERGVINYGIDFEKPWIYFLIYAALGLADAGYNTQLQSTFAIYQPDKLESAFACNFILNSFC